MAKKMVAIIQPFTVNQNIYVYENGNKIDISTFTIDEIDDIVFHFMQEYGVTQLNLMGSKQFNRGLSKKIKEAEMIKFNENKLEINII